MNTLFLLIIAVPAIEIFVMIKVGQNIGAINTIILIFFTAIVGIYYAKLEGINTLRSGFFNIYKNKVPVYEIFSGASIAIAAFLLILPGFITDIFGFILLVPLSRNIIINNLINRNKMDIRVKKEDVIDGDIIEDNEKIEKKKNSDEL